MDYQKLHDWDVTPSEAVAIQKQLRSQVRLQPFTRAPRLIAGADISFDKGSDTVYAAFVILDAKSLRVVSHSSAVVKATFPYVPGLLSFREVPPLLAAWEKLDIEPDVIVFDGQGIAHPRRLGIASHMGLVLDRPTIGCAKSRLVGHFHEPGLAAGERSELIDKGEVIGSVLRTKARTNPVFISPGHRMDLPSALKIMMSAVKGYRIPEPTRQAHLFVNQLRRDAALPEPELPLFKKTA